MLNNFKGRSRVRTGCTTCKIRHLKCDEQRPSCEHCTTAGWSCLYVKPTPIARGRPKAASYALADSTISLYRPSTSVSQDQAEQDSFYYLQSAFEHNTSGVFGTRSWYHLALQISYHEPAVRHSVCALGSLLRIFGQQEVRSNSRQQQQLSLVFALGQYTNAIRLLSRGLLSTGHLEKTALTLCISFVHIELLQHNLDAALRHLQGGLSIISSLGEKIDQYDIDQCLLQAFNRLQIQAKIHGCPDSDFNNVNSGPPLGISSEMASPFADIDDARSHLDSICAKNYSCIRRIKQLTGSSRNLGAISEPKAHMYTIALHIQRESLAKWWQLSNSLLDRQLEQGVPSNVAAACLLELQYVSQCVVYRNLFDSSEMTYDKDISKFTRVLRLCEDCLEAMRSIGHFPVSFDTGLILPLFLIALKCRVRAVRQKAIALLRQCPLREGMWHRDSVIQIAEWKLSREGCGVQIDGPMPENARIHREKMERRVCDGKDVLLRRFEQGTDGIENSEVWDVRDGHLIAAMGDMI